MRKQMNVGWALAVAVTVGLAGSVIAQEKPAAAPATPAAGQPAGQLAAAEQAFVKKAAIGNLAEVKLGEMVRDKASAQEVKDFASKMVTDHGQAQKDLEAVATAKGVQLPADLDAKHKERADKLGKLSGAELDKAYMSEMLKDHKKDVAEYESASKSIKDPDLKGYVDKTLPVLQEHLKLVQQHAGSGKEGKEEKGKGKAGGKASSEKKGA
ncbi:DUF4142 domain-containing protein [Verrucomicrobiota bacterium sgz303538]